MRIVSPMYTDGASLRQSLKACFCATNHIDYKNPNKFAYHSFSRWRVI